MLLVLLEVVSYVVAEQAAAGVDAAGGQWQLQLRPQQEANWIRLLW
jgi:hypothetical protein